MTQQKGRLIWQGALFVAILSAMGALFMHFSADAATAPVQIAPHKAVYKMSLASVKNGSSVANVDGKMYFDWSDTCDGWAVQQHLKLHFQYAEGDDTDINSSILTWESKDDKKFRFYVRRVSNGKETENFKGTASLTDQGGLGKYVLPKDKKDVVLPPGTLFPSAHTIAILRAAATGEKLFTRRVFDGSDDAGASDVSAFIGAQKTDDSSVYPPAVRKTALFTPSVWPVRLSFYKPDGDSSLPDYEMDLDLQKNGVARSMTINYGDFSVTGKLIALETQPAISCAK